MKGLATSGAEAADARRLAPVTRAAFGLLAVALAFSLDAAGTRAHAQSGWPSWPWSQPAPRPQPRPQVLQPQPQYQPPGAVQPGIGSRDRYCLQLEQDLAMDASRSLQGQGAIPRIEQDIRAADRRYQSAQADAERGQCYEYFLFSKSVRNTPRCLGLNREIEDSRRKLQDLQTERQAASGTRDSRGRQDEIIQALARNNCRGGYYNQEAAKRQQQSGPLGFLWQGEEDQGAGMRQSAVPFATFKTVCVRMCDGYYFPISYSTMQSQFRKDADVCQAKCAAPAELFYYQNPGAEMDQAVSVSGQPYSKMPNAFRHRREYVEGCSCRLAEYKPDLIGKTAAVQKRADTSASPPRRQQEGRPPGGRQPDAKQPGIGAPAAAESDDDPIGQTIERTKRDEN